MTRVPDCFLPYAPPPPPGDFDTRLNTLVLLNSLLANAPDDETAKGLLSLWESMGLSEVNVCVCVCVCAV